MIDGLREIQRNNLVACPGVRENTFWLKLLHDFSVHLGHEFKIVRLTTYQKTLPLVHM